MLKIMFKFIFIQTMDVKLKSKFEITTYLKLTYTTNRFISYTYKTKKKFCLK